MKNAALFWSAGKDSALALHRLKQNPKFKILAIVTTLINDFQRIAMHGLSEQVLERQAEQMGFPLIKMWVSNQPDNSSYEKAFMQTCTQLKAMGVDTLVFGDIFLEDLREYRETLASKIGLKTYFPLWKSSISQLQKELFEQGFEAVTCCVQSDKLGKEWIGKQLNSDFFNKLPIGVHPFGENGEFHTFCYSGPVFRSPIAFKAGEIVFRPLQINHTVRVEEVGYFYLDIK